ncbi:MAG: hypothetical protein K2H53_04200 [Clostridia bacterium]|nr:hypothetical protein [Clostridia bacterium]
MGLAVWLKKKDNFEEVTKNIMKDENLKRLKENTKKFSKANSAKEICKIIFEN